jgi:hypothetical protein
LIKDWQCSFTCFLKSQNVWACSWWGLCCTVSLHLLEWQLSLLCCIHHIVKKCLLWDMQKMLYLLQNMQYCCMYYKVFQHQKELLDIFFMFKEFQARPPYLCFFIAYSGSVLQEKMIYVDTSCP